MNTARAMALQQRRMLAAAAGMTSIMQSASNAASGMLRAMESFDSKAAARAQQGVENLEKAMSGLVDPIKQATSQLQAMSAAIPTSFGGGGAGGVTIMNTVQTANTAAVAAEQSALLIAPAAKAESKKDPDDRVKNFTTKMAEFGNMLSTFLPTNKPKDDGGAKAGDDKKGKDNGATDKLVGGISQLNESFIKLTTSQDTVGTLVQSVAANTEKMNDIVNQLGGVLVAALGHMYGELQSIASSLGNIDGYFNKMLAGQKAANADGGSAFGSGPSTPAGLLTHNGPAGLLGMGEQAGGALQAMEGENSLVPYSPGAQAAAGAAGTAAIAGPAASNEAAAAPQVDLPNLSEQMSELSQMYSSFISENEAVSSFIGNNWAFFGTMYDGANAALQVYNALQIVSKTVTFLSALATQALKFSWSSLNAVMKANVIILIISLVAGLIGIIISLAKKNDNLALIFFKCWNVILNMFDRIVVFLWTLAEGMLQPFMMFAKTVGKLFDFAINIIIDKINTVLKLINRLTGKKIDLIASFSMEEFAEDMMQFVPEQKQKAELRAATNKANRKLDEENFLAERAAARAAKEIEQEEQATDNPYIQNSDAVLSSQSNAVAVSGGRIDEVGKINDTVDISSEDIKMMRELAEMKNIQNFVTLQPSVNVQTGDIRNGMDVGSMVQAISSMLQDEIASSAEGVYT